MHVSLYVCVCVSDYFSFSLDIKKISPGSVDPHGCFTAGEPTRNRQATTDETTRERVSDVPSLSSSAVLLRDTVPTGGGGCSEGDPSLHLPLSGSPEGGTNVPDVDTCWPLDVAEPCVFACC